MQAGSILHMLLDNPSWLMRDLTIPVMSSSSARFHHLPIRRDVSGVFRLAQKVF